MLVVRKLINFDTRFFKTNNDSLCCECKIVILVHKNRLPLKLSSPILFIYLFTSANSWQGHHNSAWRQIPRTRNSPSSHPPWDIDHHTGDYVPYSLRTMRWFYNAPQIWTTFHTLYEQCIGSLTSHRFYMCKDCETGPTVYRPYPRRLESQTFCTCLYRGSTFSWVLVPPAFESAASHSAEGRLSWSNWANRTEVKVMTIRFFKRVAMNQDKQNYYRVASSLTRKILSTVFRTFALCSLTLWVKYLLSRSAASYFPSRAAFQVSLSSEKKLKLSVW